VGLLGGVEEAKLTPLDQGRMLWLREMIAPTITGDQGRTALLAVAQRATEEGEVDLALDLLSFVAQRCWWPDPDNAAHQSVIAAAERASSLDEDVRMLAILAFTAPIEQATAVHDCI